VRPDPSVLSSVVSIAYWFPNRPLWRQVFQATPGEPTYEAVKAALAMGYRHIDTAAYYRNEADVGRAIRDSCIPREEIFVTTKLMSMGASGLDYPRTLAALQESLSKLGLEYVDLYLIHSPNDKKNRLDQWRALEHAQETGLARSIGVSNYGVQHLRELAAVARVVPATNQVELHPWLTRDELVTYCEGNGILLTAWAPLAKARKFGDESVLGLARKYKCTPAQLHVRWSLQRGFVCIPKSVNPERIAENMGFESIEISDADIEHMNSWNSNMTTGWDPTRSA